MRQQLLLLLLIPALVRAQPKICGGTACSGEHMALNHEILSAASTGDNYLLELALHRASEEHMSNWAHPGGFEAWAKDKKEKPLLAPESTALHVCAFFKRFESCRILLSHHFHTNHANVKGVTPLMVAAAKGDEHIVHAASEVG